MDINFETFMELNFIPVANVLDQARSTRSSRATCCSRQCYVARGEIWNEKTYFNHFPGKTETDRRRDFGDMCYITNSSCKNVLK